MVNRLIIAIALGVLLCVTADAHPLGNFSLNKFSRITVSKSGIRLRCILDMAEIPTFQESQSIDTDHDQVLSQPELDSYLQTMTPTFAANLLVDLDGHRVPLSVESSHISLLAGSGNLNTLRLEWDFAAADAFQGLPDGTHNLRYENANYEGRVGWNEIVISGGDAGVNLFNSNGFGSSVTDEIKAYPEDMLLAPLAENAVNTSFNFTSMPPDAIALADRNGNKSVSAGPDRLAALISVPEITPSIVVLGLIFAFGLGSIHALSPGHGKTVVGAYLVGSKGTARHAAFLGLTVTITHTIGVFALGLITLFAARYILPERIMPFLSFASGLLVLLIGLSLFRKRLLALLGYSADSGEHTHDHPHDHEHDHGDGLVHTHDGHTHSHAPPESLTWKSLLSLGISGGLLPCPSALILMLSAISLNRIGYGFFLTIAFSLGLATTLVLVGLAFLYLGKLLDRPSLTANPVVRALPVFSALVISGVGAVICYEAVI